MPIWSQNLLVLLVVAACFAVVVRQGVRTLAGKKSKLGACCAKGCDAGTPKTPTTATSTSAPPQRVVFFPSDMLASSARRAKR